MFRTTDGITFRIASNRTHTRLVEVPDPPADTQRVNMTAEQARALFMGTPLERARRVAALPPARFEAVYGTRSDHAKGLAPHNMLGRMLRRIGKRLVDPIVVATLAEEPFRFLNAAAKYTDPRAQVQAAVDARVRDTMRRSSGQDEEGGT